VTLAAGTRLGSYEILSPLGAGGMGEVYRARDGKLNRDVAIKVLPEAVAEDAERLARFQREAQVLASLNHPHIAAIYGLEKSGNLEALVLELVEGETLAEKIAAGPVPIDEALAIARQIADALEAAHERGIVHRDLKPANVKVTPDGRVKVLDFGLAKALTGDASSPDQTRSPTLTAAATQAGVVIGTAAYMSPEQARGRSVDKRADIWAFGAVLYEMLSGRKAFEGETVSDTLAAVLRADIDWAALPPETPASVRRVLRRCLDRDPKTRFRDIADARIEMDAAPEPAAASAAPAAGAVHRAPWLAALLALLVLAGAGWWMALRPRPVAAAAAVRYAVTLPGADQLPFDDMPILDLSRDGRLLVFVSNHDGRSQLSLRARDRIEPSVVAGTEGASDPFFSPDGQWIGFFAEGKLKKVPIEGGVAIALADAPNNRGGVWLADDAIVYAPDYTSGLMRISSRGGKPEGLTTLDAAHGERTHRWPTYLPTDGAVLFTIGMLNGPGNYDDARIAVWDPATRKTRVVFEGGSMARFAPPNHLVFVRSEALLAVPIDASRVVPTGDPIALGDRVSGDPSSGVAYAAVAGDGTFAFVPGNGPAAVRSIVLTDRTGKARTVPGPPRAYNYPRFSPDGKRLAVSIGPGHGHSDDVWTVDLDTGALARLTFGDGKSGNYYPAWSGDGRRIAYSTDRAHQGIYLKNADGTGEEEPLLAAADPDLPADASWDGSSLLMTRGFPTTAILTVSMADRKVTPFESLGACPVFSPDGRWVAYTLESPGSRAQILVKPASGPGGKVQITSDTGAFPVWTKNGLYFVTEKKVVVADVQTEPVFKVGPLRELFDMTFDRGSIPLRNYDVSRDGQTFVFMTETSGRVWKQVDVVLDWAKELARLAPPGKK
jgi:serine/threonine-protein kinase